MDIDVIIQFIGGASVRTIVHVYDDDNALVDPTSVLITITDNDGTPKVEQENIVSTGRLEKGVFEHYYNTDSGSAKGWWQGLVEVVDGSGATARTSPANYSFEIK